MNVFAAGSVQNFCNNEEINKKSKSKVPVKKFSEVVSKLGHVYMAENKDHCEFIKKNKDNEGFVLIDSRGSGTRGFIPGAVKIISDHDDPASHEFSKDIFTKKINSYLEKKKRQEKDLSKLKFMIFCNGETCYRTSWAACSLQKMGIKRSQLYLILDGFIGLKKHCL